MTPYQEPQEMSTPSIASLRAAQQRQSMALAQQANVKAQSERAAQLRKSNLAGRGQMDYGQVSVAGGMADLLRGVRADRMENTAQEKMQGMYGDLNAGANEAALLGQQNYQDKAQLAATNREQDYTRGLASAKLANEQKVAAAAALAADKRFNVGKDASFIDKDGNLIFSGTGGKGGQGSDELLGTKKRSNSLSRILTSDQLGAATGFFDPRSLLAKGGYDLGSGKGPERQSLQSDMATVGVGGIAQNLEELKLTPVSDSDKKTLESDVPNDNSQPQEWIDYSENKYRPILVKSLQEAINNGGMGAEEATAYLSEFDADLQTAKSRWIEEDEPDGEVKLGPVTVTKGKG